MIQSKKHITKTNLIAADIEPLGPHLSTQPAHDLVEEAGLSIVDT